jgi:hypothetical protein
LYEAAILLKAKTACFMYYGTEETLLQIEGGKIEVPIVHLNLAAFNAQLYYSLIVRWRVPR